MIRKKLKPLENFFRKLFQNKVWVITYISVLLLILIITLNSHQKQEIENYSNMEYKNKYMRYSKCKESCSLKYDDPDQVKVCKKYCKCKRECTTDLNSKKCLKKCKNIKMNIYRDNPNKLEKIKLKEEIRIQNKKKKKEDKIKQARELKEKVKESNLKNTSNSKTHNYLVSILNRYASENDRMFLLDVSSSTSRFYKDFRNIFRVK